MKLGMFIHRCFRSISKIRWSKVVSNNKPREIVEQEHISVCQHGITRESIFWTADGIRKRGRPKTSCRRECVWIDKLTVMAKTKDQTWWRDCATAFSATSWRGPCKEVLKKLLNQIYLLISKKILYTVSENTFLYLRMQTK